MNFMALAVISEFDDAFYSALGDDPMTDIITNAAYDDLYKITRTSTRKISKYNHPEDFIEDDTLP